MTYSRDDPRQSDESLEELFAEVLGPTDVDDVLMNIRAAELSFSIEFVDFETMRGFHVTGPFPDPPGIDHLIRSVSLPVEDRGRGFVFLTTGTDDPEVAVSQLERILNAVDCDVGDVKSVKRRTVETGGLLGWLAKKINPHA